MKKYNKMVYTNDEKKKKKKEKLIIFSFELLLIAAEKYLAGTNLSNIFTERIKISDIKNRRKAKLCNLRV